MFDLSSWIYYFMEAILFSFYIKKKPFLVGLKANETPNADVFTDDLQNLFVA